MKINWGVLPIFVVAILGSFLLFAYRGPHPEYAFIGFFVVIFSMFGWNGWRTALLKRRLRKNGLAGMGRLLTAISTGFRSGSDPEMKLALEVTGQNGETWEAAVRQIIPQAQFYTLAPGTMFPVLYDSLDKSKVVLDSTRSHSSVSVKATVSVNAVLPQALQGPGDAAATVQAYQEMIARQDTVSRRLLTTGIVSEAKVLTCLPLHATMNHKDPLMMLMLEIQPENEPPFTGQVSGCLDSTRLDRFLPGCLIYVRYDPSDKSQIALVGSERPANFLPRI